MTNAGNTEIESIEKIFKGDQDWVPIRLDNTVISLYKKFRLQGLKAVVSGNLVEIYAYDKPLRRHIRPKRRIKTEKEIEESSLRKEEYRLRSGQKALTEIKRLVFANFAKYSKLISLTFADTDKFNISSLADCNIRRVEFINKVKKELNKDLKYISVSEYQEKRGAVHYHIICDLDYLTKDKLTKLWPYGFADIRAIDDVERSAYYIAKYVKKNRLDPKFEKKRTYHTSNNLIRPRKVYENEAAELLNKAVSLNLVPIRKGSFQTFVNGTAKYVEFVFPEMEVLNDTGKD